MKKGNRRSLAALILILAGGAIILAAFFWYQSQSTQDSIDTSVPVADIPYPQIPRVSLADAKAAYELNSAIFIDVRDELSYNDGHIPGALSIPVSRILEQSDQLDPSKWYITYCT